MKLHLIQPRELFGPEERECELLYCWFINDRIWDKVTAPEGRPTFTEMFRMCKPDMINVIANSDIYFDDTIREPIGANEVRALSRWDIQADGSAKLWDHQDSQDAWIVYGGPHEVDAPFTMGTPGCDNKLLWILREAGWRVTNPSKTIKAYHLHLVDFRSYLSGESGKARGGAKLYRLPPPYAFCKPHEL